MKDTSFGSESERMQILRMVEQGQITANEAAQLLSALGANNPEPILNYETSHVEDRPLDDEPVGVAIESPIKLKTKPRFFRVKVTDLTTGRSKVTVNLPIGLVNWGMKIGARYSSDVPNIDFNELSDMIQNGAEGKLVDVIDEEDGEHVEIFLD